MKKTLLFILTAMVVCCFSSCNEKNAPDNGNNQSDEMYVDLGLPSGTLWKSSNEVNGNHSSGLFPRIPQIRLRPRQGAKAPLLLFFLQFYADLFAYLEK